MLFKTALARSGLKAARNILTTQWLLAHCFRQLTDGEFHTPSPFDPVIREAFLQHAQATGDEEKDGLLSLLQQFASVYDSAATLQSIERRTAEFEFDDATKDCWRQVFKRVHAIEVGQSVMFVPTPSREGVACNGDCLAEVRMVRPGPKTVRRASAHELAFCVAERVLWSVQFDLGMGDSREFRQATPETRLEGIRKMARLGRVHAIETYSEDALEQLGVDLDLEGAVIRERYAPIVVPPKTNSDRKDDAPTDATDGTVNERMWRRLLLFDSDGKPYFDRDKLLWPLSRWAEELGCSRPAVKDTNAWETIMSLRAANVGERSEHAEVAEGRRSDRRRR